MVVQRMGFYLFTPAAAAITAQTCVVPVCLVDSDDLLEIWNVLHWITNYPSEAVYRCWHVSSAGMALALAFDGSSSVEMCLRWNWQSSLWSLCNMWPCCDFTWISFTVLYVVWLLPLCIPIDMCLWWNWQSFHLWSGMGFFVLCDLALKDVFYCATLVWLSPLCSLFQHTKPKKY